ACQAIGEWRASNRLCAAMGRQASRLTRRAKRGERAANDKGCAMKPLVLEKKLQRLFGAVFLDGCSMHENSNAFVADQANPATLYPQYAAFAQADDIDTPVHFDKFQQSFFSGFALMTFGM